jgi:hypothetical protein
VSLPLSQAKKMKERKNNKGKKQPNKNNLNEEKKKNVYFSCWKEALMFSEFCSN